MAVSVGPANSAEAGRIATGSGPRRPRPGQGSRADRPGGVRRGGTAFLEHPVEASCDLGRGARWQLQGWPWLSATISETRAAIAWLASVHCNSSPILET